jgi:tetratricopeptide (TPR) repeat protein
LFVVGLLAAPFLFGRNKRELFKSWLFGLGFFTLMVLLVLQIVSVGMVLMADRYSYAPYIGSLFLLALAAGSLIDSKVRPLGLATVVAFSVMQVYITYDYTKAWKNTETLWAHVISRGSSSTDPQSAIIENIKNGYTPVYVFRATHYMDTKQFEKAYQDLSFLLYSKCVNPGPYEQMGLVCGILGKYQMSVDMLTSAIAMHPVTPNIYINRAISFINLRKRDEAFKDFETAIAVGAKGRDYIQANVFVMEYMLNNGRYEDCLNRARLVQSQYPSDSEAYFFEGTALLNLGKSADAVKSLKKSLDLNPNQPGAKKNLEVAMRRTS